jgi:prepilin-type N-terminal cleavage/methylation domain-containing protein
MMIRNENKGFTLIELIIVIVVLSILSVFFFSFISNAVKSYTLVREQRALYSEGVYIMERITRELSDATDIIDPPIGTSSNGLTFLTAAHPTATPARLSSRVIFQQSDRDLSRNSIIIGRNINIPVDATDYGFKVTRNTATSPPAGTGEETITVELKLTSLNDSSIPPFILKTKITPNNYGTSSYTGRSFNGHYYEKIQ